MVGTGPNGAGDVRFSLRRLLVSVLLTVLTLGSIGSAALAAPISYPTTPSPVWRTNGIVYAVEVVGDTIYLGGSFSEMISPDGSSNQTRTNVAAINRITGELLPFRADADNIVRSIQSDGSTVYLGGTFITVNGATARRVAAVDAITGAVDTSFIGKPSGAVYSILLDHGRLFVGGTFNTVNSQAYPKLVALDAATGAIDTAFQTSPDNTVRSLAATPDGSELYVGGNYLAISGSTRKYITAVDANTGQVTGPAFGDASAQVIALDMSPDGSQLFQGVSGAQNRATAYSTTTHSRQWSHTAMGDVQAVHYASGNLYFGFHEGFLNDLNVRMLAADAATGVLIPSFRPTIDSFYGVWAIDASASVLAVGGQFNLFSGVSTKGIAVLNADNAPSDTTPPSVPTGLNATSISADSVSLGWNAATDNVAVDHYVIRRNGAVVGSPTGTNFTDTGLSPGVTYSYTVEAVDTSDNVSGPSGPLSVTTDTGAGGEVTLVASGSTWRYLDTGVFPGSTWTSPSFADGGWKTGPGQLGYGDGDENTVVARNGLTTYFRHTFAAANTAQSLELSVLRDDGVIVSLNGTEVWRNNMPAGAVTVTTPASAGVAGTAENAFTTVTIPASLLLAGSNTLAAEIHQINAASSDISFDLSLTGVLDSGPPPPTDDQDPSVPTGVTVTGTTTSSVSLSWTASTDNVAVDHYVVRRNGTVVGSPTGTTFTDTGLTAATTYAYTVEALDAAGNASGQTTAVNATTTTPPPDDQDPSIPTGVTVTGTTTSSVSLSWTASTDNVAVDHYVVRRNGTVVGSPTGTTFTDTGLTAATTYAYTVEALDAAGNASGQTTAVNATTATPPTGPVTLVPLGSTWRYLDTGVFPGSTWTSQSFADGSWKIGPAQLGYGDGDENTVVTKNGLTTYYRHSFTAANTAQSLELSVLRDDGVVVYLNGTEIWRDNMPTGAVTIDTRAVTVINGTAETTLHKVTIGGAALQAGTNVLAVEIHQQAAASSDISFDLELKAP